MVLNHCNILIKNNKLVDMNKEISSNYIIQFADTRL